MKHGYSIGLATMFGAATFFATTPASAAFLGVKITSDDGVNAFARETLANAFVEDAETAIVLRVWAVFDGPGDGVDNTVLSTSFVNLWPARPNVIFYQHPQGSTLPPNEALFGFLPALQFDSFGSIGGLTMSDASTVLNRPGADEGILHMEGGWFNSFPPNANGAASVDLGDGTFGTLLFQFTLLGDETELCMEEEEGAFITGLLSGQLSIFVQGSSQASEVPIFGGLYCTGELANDGGGVSVINGVDLAYMLSQWGPAVQCVTRSDLNNDGDVNGADLAMLLSNWGCTP